MGEEGKELGRSMAEESWPCQEVASVWEVKDANLSLAFPIRLHLECLNRPLSRPGFSFIMGKFRDCILETTVDSI